MYQKITNKNKTIYYRRIDGLWIYLLKINLITFWKKSENVRMCIKRTKQSKMACICFSKMKDRRKQNHCTYNPKL